MCRGFCGCGKLTMARDRGGQGRGTLEIMQALVDDDPNPSYFELRRCGRALIAARALAAARAGAVSRP